MLPCPTRFTTEAAQNRLARGRGVTLTVKLEDHPAIKRRRSCLSWAQSGGASPQIHSLDSVLKSATIIVRPPHAGDHIQLARHQDSAIAILGCENQSFLQNLC